jgi:aminoglycoside-2''-adenylyltransferase
VAGGWALDLFVGRVTRPHNDVDIALFREDQGQLRSHFSAWEWYKLSRGQAFPWRADEFVGHPVHELWASRRGERLEFLLNERRGDRWLFRRNLNIARELSRVQLAHEGIPYLPPEIVLLYKAKIRNEKDIGDCDRVLTKIPEEARAWLQEAEWQVCENGK